MAKNLGNVAGVVRGINPPKEADGSTEKRYVIWAKQLHTTPVSYQLMYFDFITNQWVPLTGQTLQELNLIKQLAFGSLNTTEIQAGLGQLGGASILEYLLNQNTNNCNSFKNCLNNLPIVNVEDLYGSGFVVALEYRANLKAIEMGLKPGDAFWLRLEGTKEVPLVLCRVRETSASSGSGSGSGEGSNGGGGGVIDAWLNAHYLPIGTSNDTLFGGAQMGPYARIAKLEGTDILTGEFSSTGISQVNSWSGNLLNYNGDLIPFNTTQFINGTFRFTTQTINLDDIKEIQISISAYNAGGILYTSGQYIWKRQILTNFSTIPQNPNFLIERVILHKVGTTMKTFVKTNKDLLVLRNGAIHDVLINQRALQNEQRNAILYGTLGYYNTLYNFTDLVATELLLNYAGSPSGNLGRIILPSGENEDLLDLTTLSVTFNAII